MDKQTLIDQLVSQWEERRSRGVETTAEELCRDHPEVLETLQQELTSRTMSRAPSSESPGPTLLLDSEATCDATMPTQEETAELIQLGQFQIIKLIAEGGMGAVYEAIDVPLGRKVALKLMHGGAVADEMARARFLREARTAARLEHDHIVPIYQVGEDKGVPYLAMQLLRGQTLDERMRQGPPISQSEVLRIGREIAEGLAAAHAHGLIHRDIKPANVWLEEGSGRVKILDFGLARVVSETARLTQDGSILGTPAYMAPEQASGSSAVDHRSDLFSLGSVLYRMGTGKLLFPASSSGAMLLALVRDDPVPPRQINPELPPAFEALILELLAREPDQRPQTAQAVVEQIRRLERIEQPEAREGVDLEVTTEEPGSVLPVRRASRLWPALVFSLALAIIGGLVAAASLLPRLLDAAGNSGELTLDSPVREVAVGVGQEGRPVGVLDLATRPRLRLPAGTYALELADTTGTLKLATPRVDLRRGSRQVVRVVRNIAAAAARKPAAIGPFTDADVSRIAALPAAQQVEEVSKALQQHNPGFGGELTPNIERDVVVALKLNTDHVADISPVRALTRLQSLVAQGTQHHGGSLVDLAPLKGMSLTRVWVGRNKVFDLAPLKGMPVFDLGIGSAPVADLSPLKGMPIKFLSIEGTEVSDLTPLAGMRLERLVMRVHHVSDLTPLAGMPLKWLDCGNTSQNINLGQLAGLPLEALGLDRSPVSDLTQLRGMPLKNLALSYTQVTDLAPLAGMPLNALTIDGTPVTDLTPLKDLPLKKIVLDFQAPRHAQALRAIKTLETINGKPAAQFWKEVDKK